MQTFFQVHRKDSAMVVTISANVPDELGGVAQKEEDNMSEDFKIRTYPFAVVLRIRVLQVKFE